MTTMCEGPCADNIRREDALLLACFHPVCGDCGRSGSATDDATVICRRCETRTSAADLIPDHVTRHISMADSITKTRKECDNGCSETVTFRCLQCTLDLCSRCAHSHPRSLLHKDHKVVRASDVGPVDVDIPVECPIHKGEPIKAYCARC